VTEVEQLIESHGFLVSRRSSWHSQADILTATSTSTNKPVILLGDSLGEMALYYSLSDVALLGGSFEPLGGQNLIEAAACACPIVMGPHTFNFAEASQAALAAGAAIRAENIAMALESAVALAQDTPRLITHSENAKRFASEHGGATQRTADAVRHWLKD
jgi:3-deoxy-D-manno-octulosonic-acid transferase